jgi:hypothetical protein
MSWHMQLLCFNVQGAFQPLSKLYFRNKLSVTVRKLTDIVVVVMSWEWI